MPRKAGKTEKAAVVTKETVADVSKVKTPKTTKTVKKIPSSENGPSITCTTKSGKIYLVTQNKERQRFTLWQQMKDGFRQISTAKSPLILEDKVPWDK